MKNNLNLPPFWVGQKVVCVKGHSNLTVIKDKKYTITSITKACHGFNVTVGVAAISAGVLCITCGKRYPVTSSEQPFSSSRFAPVQEAKFPLIKLSKVIENEPALSEN